jgi:hypothetical protein
VIGQNPTHRRLWSEITDSIEEITDASLIDMFRGMSRKSKSLSECINDKIRENLVGRGWSAESPIFQDSDYRGKKWRLDFAKEAMSIEVGFNHGEAIAWNLLKPVMASEMNHISKAIQTEIGVIITASKALKIAGGFDSAVGELEKYIRYLRPMSTILPTPLVLVGLLPPETFRIAHQVGENNKKYGVIVDISDA